MGNGGSYLDRPALHHADTDAVAQFQHLYETHFPRIISFLARRGIPRDRLDDLAQEAFSRAWAAWRDRPLDPAFRQLLWGIVKNVLREQRRSAATGQTQQLGDEANSLPSKNTAQPPGELERREDVEQVQAALAALPPRQRQAVELVEIGNLTIQQAAKIAGCTSDSLQWHRRIAIRSLKNLLAHAFSQPSRK